MKKNIIIGVTGSVACYKSLDLIRGLRRLGLSTEVVLTKEAEEFIRPVLFRSLSGNKVIRWDMFGLPEEWDVAHISLADRADLVIIMPATANIIGKIASGICDDMLTCVVCAAKAPVLFVPAMNSGMYENKIVRGNIERLKKAGYYFTGPVKGKLACGDTGLGHVQDTEIILSEAGRLLKQNNRGL
jgi:phosphopantothenoylcysteine decarboxylase / phosphopantothenate---cysteine ligase